MVLDNVRYHHAKRLKPLLEKYKDKIELIFLPPYSPDLNPIERIWWYMRKKITHNRYVVSLEERLILFREFIKQFEEPSPLGRDIARISIDLKIESIVI